MNRLRFLFLPVLFALVACKAQIPNASIVSISGDSLLERLQQGSFIQITYSENLPIIDSNKKYKVETQFIDYQVSIGSEKLLHYERNPCIIRWPFSKSIHSTEIHLAGTIEKERQNRLLKRQGTLDDVNAVASLSNLSEVFPSERILLIVAPAVWNAQVYIDSSLHEKRELFIWIQMINEFSYEYLFAVEDTK